MIDSFIRKSISAMPDDSSRGAVLGAYLTQVLARALKMPASSLSPTRPITQYGMDSLTAIELKNEIERELGVNLPMTLFLEGHTLPALCSEILALMFREGSAGEMPAFHIAPTPPPTAPLSHGQRALWFLHQLTPDSAVYNVARAIEIKDGVEMPAFRTALQQLVANHPILRTTFVMDNAGIPHQKIHPSLPADLQLIDARTWDTDHLDQQLNQYAYQPFDLETGPLLHVRLFQQANNHHTLLLVLHHIITDFWSLVLLVDELIATYQSARQEISEKTTSSRHHLRPKYTDYTHWQQAVLDSHHGEKWLSHWGEQLHGNLPLLNLPTTHPRPPIQTNNGRLYAHALPTDLSQRATEFAQAQGVTMYTLLMATFQLLLYRYTGQDDILVGSPTAGRDTAHLQNLLGYLVNPVVVRTKIDPSADFYTLLSQVQETVLGALAHSQYPFPLLVENLNQARNPSHSPIFQAMFVWQQAQTGYQGDLSALALGLNGIQVEVHGLTLHSKSLTQQMAQYDIMLTTAEVGDTIVTAWEYNADLFDEPTMALMAEHFQGLLWAVLNQPQAAVSKPNFLTDRERNWLAEWNKTTVDYRNPTCLHTLFEQQVARTPHAIALVYEDETLTYQQLNERANQLAHQLLAWGVQPDQFVGVCMERSVEMVVALYGVMKAGAAYVPIDPTYPADRLAFMLNDAKVPALLTQSHILPTLPVTPYLTLTLDTHPLTNQPTNNPTIPLLPHHLAYTIYTSGSTGKPKGAMNSHRAIVNRLRWMQEAYQLDTGDHVLQKTPFSFDVSVWEFFWTLITGARLVVAKPNGHLDSDYLVTLIRRQQISTMHFVPSMLQVFLDADGVDQCTSLRRVICSGEALPYDLQERFFQRLPNCELHNLYGPTEAAIDVSYWQCLPQHSLGKVPIGYPIANIQLHILDQHMQPVPVGVAGELHIGGVGVGRGYHNRPRLTAEKFVPDPFQDEPSFLYKTGDLARYLPDGAIEYLGRLDFQVKLRGFRIELGEIEAKLLDYPAIREVVVTVFEAEPGDQRLVAYVTPMQGATVTASEVKAYLAKLLPDYMVPAFITILETLPLTPNGKVNRGALPTPTISRADLQVQYIAPRNQLEQAIAHVLAEVLKVEKVGLNDNFFDMGGHSLLLVQVQRRLQTELARDIPLMRLLEHTTVRSLAQFLTKVGDHNETLLQKSVERAEKQKSRRRRMPA